MFTSILDSVMQESSVAPITSAYNSFVALLGGFFPFLVMALCLVIGLFGRRLADVIRVVLLFAIGFVASVYWLAPLIQQFVPEIPALAVGLVVGLLCAVLSRMIYNFVYIGCIGFDTYNISYSALFLAPLTALTEGNLPLCIALGLIAVIITLLVRKHIEMIITAAIGGIGVAFFVKSLFDYTTLVPFDPNLSMVVLGLVLAVPMFVYQYRNRYIY